jgi:hypothetical protein
MSLILHCGSSALSRNDLYNIPTPMALGARHGIYPVHEFVDTLYDSLQDVLRPKSEKFGVLMDKDTGLPRRFFGLLEMAGNDTFALQIGIRGSFDQSIAAGLAVGSRVFVCDNLAFSGDIEIKTKQTTRIEARMPGLIAQAVDRLPAMIESQNSKYERWRNTVLSPRVGDAMLLECVRRGALLPTQLPDAIREWDTPTHPEHAAEGFSLWRLHNAVTEAARPTDPVRQLPAVWTRTQTLTQILEAA